MVRKDLKKPHYRKESWTLLHMKQVLPDLSPLVAILGSLSFSVENTAHVFLKGTLLVLITSAFHLY